MKYIVLLPLIASFLIAFGGCTPAPSKEADETRIETEAQPESEARLNMIGISYYWSSGSMAGMDYTYSVSEAGAGVYLFRAELESGFRSVEKEISKEEFDSIMKIVNDSYSAKSSDENEALDEYTALDADSCGFDAIFADEQTQPIELGKAGSEVVALLRELLEQSTAQ